MYQETLVNYYCCYLQWYSEVREHCTTQPIILVGCKTDLRSDASKQKKQGIVTYDMVNAV